MMDPTRNEESVELKLAEGFIKHSPNSQTDAAPTHKTLTVAEVEIGITPFFFEIVQNIMREVPDANARQREGGEFAQKILELEKRFESARSQIKLLRGIEFNKEEQLEQLELMRSQLESKQALIRKYKTHFV